MAKCVAEIDSSLPSLNSEKVAYSHADVEASLPYLRQSIRENFRITPVFTMPLARRITAAEGITIAGRHIKQGVSPRFISSRSILGSTLPHFLTGIHPDFRRSV